VRVEVDVEGASAGERVVRPYGVEELPVALDVEAEVVSVVDLVPVEVLVLQGAEGSFADSVLAGALPLRTDVDQLRVAVDEGSEARRLEAGPIVRHDRDGPDLARLTVGDELEQRAAEQQLRLGECELDGLDRVAVVLSGRDVVAELELRPVVGARQVPPIRVSNSVKSSCQT
jgi:hypothetical protein